MGIRFLDEAGADMAEVEDALWMMACSREGCYNAMRADKADKAEKAEKAERAGMAGLSVMRKLG